ncbi:MAG: hypothetical protein WCJ86_00490 [Candidatus Saccharibacteria bacterium]
MANNTVQITELNDAAIHGEKYSQAYFDKFSLLSAADKWDVFLSLPEYDLLSLSQQHIGSSGDTNSIDRLNTILYSRNIDFGIATNQLLDVVNNDEREQVFTRLSSLTGKSQHVGKLFPDELESLAAASFGETVQNFVYTLGALKNSGNLPDNLPLGDNGKVDVGSYSFDKAVSVLGELDDTISRITTIANDTNSPVQRVNQTGSYGMYRLGDNGQVLATVRILASTNPDTAIEYGNRDGAQASIGYSVDVARTYNSPYKKEQKNPFSIRIDNEGDKLALDIGSILGKPGTLGKEVADLIAIGDSLRSRETGDSPRLNHNSRLFVGTGLEDRQVFARVAAQKAEEFERRAIERPLRQLVLNETVVSLH